MKLRDIERFTPVHWVLIAVAAIAFAVASVQILGILGFRWDPLNSAERRADLAGRTRRHGSRGRRRHRP